MPTRKTRAKRTTARKVSTRRSSAKASSSRKAKVLIKSPFWVLGGIVLGAALLYVLLGGARTPETFEQKPECAQVERDYNACEKECGPKDTESFEWNQCHKSCKNERRRLRSFHHCEEQRGGGGNECWCVDSGQCPVGWDQHTGASYGCAQKPDRGPQDQDVFCCPSGQDPSEQSYCKGIGQVCNNDCCEGLTCLSAGAGLPGQKTCKDASQSLCIGDCKVGSTCPSDWKPISGDCPTGRTCCFPASSVNPPPSSCASAGEYCGPGGRTCCNSLRCGYNDVCVTGVSNCVGIGSPCGISNNYKRCCAGSCSWNMKTWRFTCR